MLFLGMYRAPRAPKQVIDRLPGAVAKLPRSYKRLLAPALQFQAETLGVDPGALVPIQGSTAARSRDEVVVYGELLVKDQSTVGVVGEPVAGPYPRARGRAARAS